MLAHQIRRLEAETRGERAEAASQLELARLYERAGDPMAAIRAASEAVGAGGGDLAQRCRAQLIEKHGATLIEKHGVTLISREEYESELERLFSRPKGALFSRVVPVQLPSSKRKRAVYFSYILSYLEPDERYPPDDINYLISAALEELYLISDHCHVRRYMLSMRMLRRNIEGTLYWRNPSSPVVIG